MSPSASSWVSRPARVMQSKSKTMFHAHALDLKGVATDVSTQSEQRHRFYVRHQRMRCAWSRLHRLQHPLLSLPSARGLDLSLGSSEGDRIRRFAPPKQTEDQLARGCDIWWSGGQYVAALKDVRIHKVAAGEHHCAVIDMDGLLYVWGDNSSRQVGQCAPLHADFPAREQLQRMDHADVYSMPVLMNEGGMLPCPSAVFPAFEQHGDAKPKYASEACKSCMRCKVHDGSE